MARSLQEAGIDELVKPTGEQRHGVRRLHDDIRHEQGCSGKHCEHNRTGKRSQSTGSWCERAALHGRSFGQIRMGVPMSSRQPQWLMGRISSNPPPGVCQTTATISTRQPVKCFVWLQTPSRASSNEGPAHESNVVLFASRSIWQLSAAGSHSGERMPSAGTGLMY